MVIFSVKGLRLDVVTDPLRAYVNQTDVTLKGGVDAALARI